MRRVPVILKKNIDDSYDIEIERGIFRRVASDLRMKRFADQYVIITDKTVNRFYGNDLSLALKREKLFLGKIVVKAGEESKRLKTLEEIFEKMIAVKANRHTGIIALGGGMVGDLAGFAAASFMRGIPYVHIPTTLLAMLDSSVGGKVGVDLASGKNLVGVFYQPKKVYIDTEFLLSLPEKQWKSGLAEAIKYGLIKDRSLFEFFEKHVSVWNKLPKNFLFGEIALAEEMIQRCIQIKADVVMKDEKEGNLRQILNYGHSFGHVIELMSGYKVLHGEAIATGMKIAALLANKLRFMPDHEQMRQNELFNKLGLGKTKTKGLIKDFIQNMKSDKKSKGDLRVVLVDRIGRCHQEMGKYGIKVSEKLVREVLLESRLIDDKPISQPPLSHDASYSWQAQSTPGETELQRRLREMRERRERMQREGRDTGGFLP